MIYGQSQSQTVTVPSPLSQSVIDERAQEIGQSLRCVVCQNQSIEESDASLAKDMRVLVRERIAAGESNAEVVEFMRSRYGDYVLLKPPLQNNTYALWFFPAILVLGMSLWLLHATRRKRGVQDTQPDALSDEEKEILDRIMDNNS
jgi:cytochrome c-type biogenesis protein CcmH